MPTARKIAPATLAPLADAPTLPQGWVWTTIGEVADTTSGGTPSRSIADYYNGDIPWIKSGELKDSTIFRAEEYISEAGLKNSSAKIFPAGTALVALYGATVGKTGVLGLDAATNQAVCAIFPKSNSLDEKFVMYWFLSQRQNLVDLSVGGAQPNISQLVIRNYPLPLPPLAEQRRIVAAIEALLTRLDAAVASLRAAQTRLRRYRASVLKAACEGRLVPQDPGDEPADALLGRILDERRERWEAELLAKGRDASKARYQPPAEPDTAGLPELPQGWAWASVEQVGEIRLGRQRAPQHHTGQHMRPYLRVANVFEDRIDTRDIMEMNFTPQEYETYRLEYGDILLNEGQSKELVGRPAMYRNEVQDACFQNTLVRFRVAQNLLPAFALIIFRSYLHMERFQRIARWTTNIAHLGADRFAKLEFPLPPLAEQRRIVAEVERRLSVASAAEASVAANLRRAARLRQAVLKRAFAGKLVAQDPNDEPASALLERVREQRDQGARRGAGLQLQMDV